MEHPQTRGSHPLTFDLQTIFQSKERYRKQAAALPIAEKLRKLDAMRERKLLIRALGKQPYPLATALGNDEQKQEPSGPTIYPPPPA